MYKQANEVYSEQGRTYKQTADSEKFNGYAIIGMAIIVIVAAIVCNLVK